VFAECRLLIPPDVIIPLFFQVQLRLCLRTFQCRLY